MEHSPPAILGVELLIERFGYWPSFHDAEVVWLNLNRRTGLRNQGPTIEMLVHVFEMTSEVTSDGYYRLTKHSLVHFRFEGVTNVSVNGFNHQNVLAELDITDQSGVGCETKSYLIKLSPCYGLGGTFQCVAPEILTVSECDSGGDMIALQRGG